VTKTAARVPMARTATIEMTTRAALIPVLDSTVAEAYDATTRCRVAAHRNTPPHCCNVTSEPFPLSAAHGETGDGSAGPRNIADSAYRGLGASGRVAFCPASLRVVERCHSVGSEGDRCVIGRSDRGNELQRR
jgi:hypothetical protein